MSGPSGFHEVRSSPSRSPANRFLYEQRHQVGTGSWHRYRAIPVLGVLLLWLLGLLSSSQAQGSPPPTPITSSGLHTQVTLSATPPTGMVQYDITGGTRPGGGTNLFHSFGDFNVPNNNIANFLNDSGLATSNILGRVTGGNISNIFGAIQTTGFGNANLFLMNAAGFLFGPTATVNVGGMMTFTSADYLRLANAVLFNAIPNATADALLSAAPVTAFGFLGSNPGAITVQGSQFSVADGMGISLIGGNIAIQNGTLESGTVQPARLSAPNGQINLATAKSPGEFLQDLTTAPNINGASFTSSGSMHFTPGSIVDVSQTGNGKVSIRGGQFVLEIQNAFLSTADTAAPAVVIPGQDTIILSGGSSIASVTTSADPGSDVQINATQVELNLGTITASTGGPGDAGTIHINATDRIALTNHAIIASASENLFSNAQGNGGTITLHAPHIALSEDALISSSTTGPGNAGDVVLETQSLIMSGVGTQGGRVITNTQGPGQGGNITVQGLEGPQSAAEVVQLTHGSGLLAQTIGGLTGAEGNAGSIHVQAASLVLDGSSQLSTAAQDSAGGAGTVIVDATDSVHLSGHSSITSNSAGASFGPAGDITITSPTIWLKGASFISTSTEFVGTAGNITLHTQALSLTEDSKLTSNSGPQLVPEFLSGSAGSVTIQGQGSPAQSVLIDGAGSGIFTDTQGTGAGGNIFVNANSITLQNGGRLSAETSGTAATAIGGTITVDATNTITMSSALITARSAGMADAGSINITSPNGFTMQSSTITTQAGQGAGGGNIKVTTSPAATVLLQDSTISASVADGHGGGGNISIDPQFVILQNSQILAQAAQGQGGAITITAGLFLPDANSIVSADSGSGVNGTVTIQSPNAPISGQIQPLGKTPLIATSLLNQHCAALADGAFSSFTVAGRDSLPTEPGGWLASPLALGSAGFSGGAVAKSGAQPRVMDPAQETTVLSLRQIAPAGFLTQAFATDSSTGCS